MDNNFKRKNNDAVMSYPVIENEFLKPGYSEKKAIAAKYIILLRETHDRASRYPSSDYFLEEEFVRRQLMTAKSQTIFMKEDYIDKLPNFLRHCTIPYQGEEWILKFKDSDFEKIDILSNFFTEKVRILSNVRGKPSPFKYFDDNTDKVVFLAIDYALKNNIDLNAKAMSEAIFNSGIKICTTFKISLGIAVFEQVFQSKRVFDPFAGWGDRALAAFMSKGVTYYKGIDVNSSLFPCYENMKKFLTNLNPSKSISFENKAIEDVNFVKEITNQDIDTIFSSPPFYDYENYSTDDKQSTLKYKTRESWLENWFIPVSFKMISCLKSRGYFCYYLGGNDKDIFDTLYHGLKQPSVRFLGQIAVTNGFKRPLFLFVWCKK
jgi:16S rRNA G966 N2-methylase RsmD